MRAPDVSDLGPFVYSDISIAVYAPAASYCLTGPVTTGFGRGLRLLPDRTGDRDRELLIASRDLQRRGRGDRVERAAELGRA